MDPRDLRVGNAEREHVAALLQQAAGDGMLTLDEFSDRMDAALAAKTRGELSDVLTDLPGMQLAIQRPTDQHHVPAPSQQAPSHAGTLALRANMSSLRRAGAWQVPEHVTLRSRFSSVLLDLTQARIGQSVLVLEVDDICSSIDIVVPDDFTADLNELHSVGGSADSHVGSASSAGRVHVIVRGKLRFGALTVKHPFGARLRRWLG